MAQLNRRNWVPAASEELTAGIAAQTAARPTRETIRRIEALAERNARIHDAECFNLNPATNVMNPRAAALLSRGLGERPSLGYPGEKYETGLEAIEEIEVICAALAAETFDAGFAEVRVPSGAIANLYGFMASCRPGDTIIAPPAAIGGHVTHHPAGCAGLYGLKVIEAPVAVDGYSIDVAALAECVRDHRPRLITLGGSLNLFPHPVAEVRALADTVGAVVLFDAAHQCGIIAGGSWPNPLDQGAHLMTMSTYKSLGGPAGGLVVTRDAALAERIDRIAFPGMTANFDAGKTAALAVTLCDWRDHGAAYSSAMIDLARALAEALQAEGLPVFGTSRGSTRSHQFALEAAGWGGGQAMARMLARAGFLACGIGLPIAPVPGDMNGLRIGTPELARRGLRPQDAPRLAGLIARALREDSPDTLAREVAQWRQTFTGLHYITP